MRILHTADWHLNQTLNGWPRDAEHAAWLARLADVIEEERIDALLIAGDVYDIINPSGEAQRLFYRALRTFKERRPGLVTIVTGGNHDPAGRLEAPNAILEGLDVHVFATIRRSSGEVDHCAHMIPLAKDGETAAWVCAIPFLRAADLPGLSFTAEDNRGSPIVEAARLFHAKIADAAQGIAGDLPVIAMGHLHCHGATESEGAERRILIGGEHALPEDVFPESFRYVALGHLHRAQSLASGGFAIPAPASRSRPRRSDTITASQFSMSTGTGSRPRIAQSRARRRSSGCRRRERYVSTTSPMRSQRLK